MKEQTKEYYNELKKLVSIALNGKTMGISVSETDFGTSMYLQDHAVKMRFSDHSVGFKRFGEDLWSLIDIINNPSLVIKGIDSNFSDNYTNLIILDGDRFFKMGRILKSELKNYEQVIVKTTEVVEVVVKLEDISDRNLISIGELTKNGKKRFCKISKNIYNRGLINNATGKITSVYCRVMFSQLENETDRIINE